jgi:hypothetical protein
MINSFHWQLRVDAQPAAEAGDEPFGCADSAY